MALKRNPYAISFGRIPTQYISRSLLIDEIIDTLNSDVIEEQAFKLTGIRGTGKTVTLTSIERELRESDDWIVIDLKSNSDIINDLVSNLYTNVPFVTDFIDANLNLSAFGIGVNISKKSPAASLDAALERLLTEIKKRNKKVLIAIDEVRKTEAIIDFVQEFQILVRKELPAYLIVAGLYEDIEALENTDGLTFFLRAAQYEMPPLNIGVIKADYEKTLGLSGETAYELAVMTKGYAFAYQAFGKYMWDAGAKSITEEVLAQVDEALAQKVYDKIWSELTSRDKWFLEFIVQRDTMSATELLEKTKKRHNEWSEPRKRLIDKGIINGSTRGVISVRLPRFKEYIDNKHVEF